MANQPTEGGPKVLKDALPASIPKSEGNPVFRMMGEFM